MVALYYSKRVLKETISILAEIKQQHIFNIYKISTTRKLMQGDTT
jgi:hypothetical protein